MMKPVFMFLLLFATGGLERVIDGESCDLCFGICFLNCISFSYVVIKRLEWVGIR